MGGPASNRNPLRFAFLWRGDPSAAPPDLATSRLGAIAAALGEQGATAEPVAYADEVADALLQRLLAVDGVLVWVDPLTAGKDRSRLDPMLRAAAQAGVWVSAHPDVILKMGVKAVLHRTRHLGWGVETELYADADSFRAAFPHRLAEGGPRVLKQNRGNGGQGVWKVAFADAAGAAVTVLHAQRGSRPETLPLADFMARCEAYFAGDGAIIDQPFQPRLPEGMIRCYQAGDRVAGYGHQLIKALVDPPDDGPPHEPGPRIMHPPDAPPFQALRRLMEGDWIPAMQQTLGIETADLPALWDADFLLGPKTPEGADTYVLCEINVSAVAPFPDSAAAPAARWAIEHAARAKAARPRPA